MDYCDVAPSSSFDESEFYWILIMDIIYNVYYRSNMYISILMCSCIHAFHDKYTKYSCIHVFMCSCIHAFHVSMRFMYSRVSCVHVFMRFMISILGIHVFMCSCVHVFTHLCGHAFMYSCVSCVHVLNTKISLFCWNFNEF